MNIRDTRRRCFALAALLVVVGGCFLWFGLPLLIDLPPTPAPASPPNISSGPPRVVEPSVRPLEVLTVADDHGRVDSTIAGDLALVQAVLESWLTNRAGEGLPVGDNREITAALCGRNRLHVAFLNPRHSSINLNGELCDRWSTPYRFHALSSTRMEIASAGPDRRFGTDDDAGSFTPAP